MARAFHIYLKLVEPIHYKDPGSEGRGILHYLKRMSKYFHPNGWLPPKLTVELVLVSVIEITKQITLQLLLVKFTELETETTTGLEL